MFGWPPFEVFLAHAPRLLSGTIWLARLRPRGAEPTFLSLWLATLTAALAWRGTRTPVLLITCWCVLAIGFGAWSDYGALERDLDHVTNDRGVRARRLCDARDHRGGAVVNVARVSGLSL